MMEIELDRYQNKFKTEEKQKAKHELSLAQTASIVEASSSILAEQTEAHQSTEEKKRISDIFGARGAYIANALSNVAIHQFLILAAIFTAMVLLLSRGLKWLTTLSTSTVGDDTLKKGGISVNFAA